MPYKSRRSRILERLQLGAVEVAHTREVERCRQHAVLTLAHPPPTEVTPHSIRLRGRRLVTIALDSMQR